MTKEGVIYSSIDEDVEKKILFINKFYKVSKREVTNQLIPIVVEEILQVDDIVVLEGERHTFEFYISCIIDNQAYGRLIEIKKHKKRK